MGKVDVDDVVSADHPYSWTLACYGVRRGSRRRFLAYSTADLAAPRYHVARQHVIAKMAGPDLFTARPSAPPLFP